MEKSILALGIECSCDDTAIGLVELTYNNSKNKIQDISGKIISSYIFDQKELHTEYGGVVPEIAAGLALLIGVGLGVYARRRRTALERSSAGS